MKQNRKTGESQKAYPCQRRELLEPSLLYWNTRRAENYFSESCRQDANIANILRPKNKVYLFISKQWLQAILGNWQT